MIKHLQLLAHSAHAAAARYNHALQNQRGDGRVAAAAMEAQQHAQALQQRAAREHQSPVRLSESCAHQYVHRRPQLLQLQRSRVARGRIFSDQAQGSVLHPGFVCADAVKDLADL